MTTSGSSGTLTYSLRAGWSLSDLAACGLTSILARHKVKIVLEQPFSSIHYVDYVDKKPSGHDAGGSRRDTASGRSGVAPRAERGGGAARRPDRLHGGRGHGGRARDRQTGRLDRRRDGRER